MNKQQLASKIWESANKMRSKIEANEYKDYILGFIFYKFLSDKEVKFLIENEFSNQDIRNIKESNDEMVAFIQNNIGYFIEYKNLFSTWLEKGVDFSVSDVRDALSAFDRLINKTHSKVFNGIFKTLQTGLSKLGDSTSAQNKAVKDLINLIKDIPMDGKQDYDVLGFIYEYLISNFAANAGKKAGEFYTPHEVSLLMSEIIANDQKNKNEIKIYDPTSGSGSLLINIGKTVAKHIKDPNDIKYYAQELKENTYNLTRMNLVMRGVLPDNIVTRNGDTLEDDWPYFDDNDPENTYDPLYVDAVVSNPPYSQSWEPEDRENDARYKSYGLAPKGKADYAFLLHDLYHLKPDGIMTIVLPHGVLFRGGDEREIRKNLIEKNNIDTIIGLPSNIFFGTGIPTIIMILKKNKTNTDVQIIDASKGFVKEGKNNKLRARDIKKIVDTVINREDVNKYSRIVPREEIRNNDYNLNIPRYVDSSEEGETYDIYASMFGGTPLSEIDRYNKYWEEFPGLKTELFSNINDSYCELKVANVRETIMSNAKVIEFAQKFDVSFNGFDKYLKNELIENLESINVPSQEEKLSQEIFSRLNNINLIDKYQAYQLLDNEWKKIATDLEIIQTEGDVAIKTVDPNMVLKKKEGKEEEIQDGWIGRIIPFDLIQKVKMQDKIDELKELEDKLVVLISSYEEILDSLTEEQKEEISDLLTEENDAFVPKEVSTKAKELKKIKKTFEEESLERKILNANDIIECEKATKKRIKEMNSNIQAQSKLAIESLSDEECFELLEIKWITPIIQNINELKFETIKEFVANLDKLSKKYETTLMDLEKKINETEKKLANMIDDLTGNEYDMKGLEEFKSLLLGGFYE